MTLFGHCQSEPGRKEGDGKAEVEKHFHGKQCGQKPFEASKASFGFLDTVKVD